MNLQYASDLHIEFSQNMDFLDLNPIKPFGDVLVLAGDVVPLFLLEKYSAFFDYLSDRFQVTYWIPGNHEFYHSDLSWMKDRPVHKAIRKNVFLVNNTTAFFNDVKLIFTTLWSKISPVYEKLIVKALNDFHLIQYKGEPFSVAVYNQLFEESLGFLKKELTSGDADKMVVLTHHMPTFLNYPSRFLGNILNEAFGVELFDFMEMYGPDYWVYGHSHVNTPKFEIGRTSLLTNQMGYVKYEQHLSFDRERIIEV